MRRPSVPVLVTTALWACAGAADLGPVSVERLQQHVEFLGSDSLQGRATGTQGTRIAADYIARQLEQLHLEPAGGEGSFFQSIPMHGSVPLDGSHLSLHLGDTTIDLQLGRDYLLYSSGESTFVPRPVDLVFAGYGIIAPEFDYNDYQSVDVRGKIVVFLTGEPFSDDPQYFAGDQPTVYSSPEAKQRLALSRGARGTVLVQSYAEPDPRSWQEWQQLFAFEDIRLMYHRASSLDVVMRGARAARLFDGARFSLDEIFKMEKRHAITSFPLASAISFHGQFQQRDFVDRNVLALLPGQHPQLRETALLVTAHYDHLGIGPPVDGDNIYNGVFDNAAGVAAVLEMARVLSQATTQRRSILFAFLTGEEKGLLGSQYYVDHPVVPLYRTIANLNVDGISMFEPVNDFIGIGAELSTLGTELVRVAADQGVRISPLPALFAGSETFTVSDQLTFARAGIPAILVMEGMDYRRTPTPEAIRRLIDWGHRVYHSPQDDLAQPIDWEAAAQHTQLLAAYSHHLSNAEPAPEWHRISVGYINARLQSIAEKR